MNKDLYGEKVELPEDVVMYLGQCHDEVPDATDSEGYKRNKELRDTGYVTYTQLKRMKNFFDNFKGHENDKSFILNGGHFVKKWVSDTLNRMRDNAYMSKDIKSIVLPNQFIDTHEKNNNLNNKSHQSTLAQYNLEITENLKQINNLIKNLI